MVPLAAASVASRFVEPLAHPWAAVTGIFATLTAAGGETPMAVIRVAWRLTRLLLSL